MKDTTRTCLSHWLEGQIAQCDDRILTLNADCRGDEAVFAKIRRNVLDIFRTILTVPGGDFAGKLAQIPRSWEVSLAKAAEHGETEKAHIESIKLAAAGQILKTYTQLEERP